MSETHPVASRTRRKLGKDRLFCGDRKRRKPSQVEVVRSYPASREDSTQVHILAEEMIKQDGKNHQPEPLPEIIFLGSSDDGDSDEEDDDSEDSDDNDSMGISDQSLSGEDDSDPEDLEYYAETEEEDSQSSSSSEDDVVLETPRHAIGKRKSAEVEFVCEYTKEGEMISNGFVAEDDDSTDEDGIESKSSKTKSHVSKNGCPSFSNSKHGNLLSILTDLILDKHGNGSNTLEETIVLQEDIQENLLPQKFTFGVKERIVAEKSEMEKEIDSLWSEMNFCSAGVDEDVIELKCSETKHSNPNKRERHASSDSKQLPLLSVLTDTILDKEGSDSNTVEETVIRHEEVEETTLPLKFTFGVKEIIVPEKTEYEKEMDALWSDMQFCSEIGSNPTPSSPVENEDANIPEFNGTTQSDCLQGKHCLVQDDEIGIICKYCSFVKLESKYVSAPFLTDHSGRYERYMSSIEGPSLFDGLLDEDPNDKPGFDQSANIEGTVWEIIPDLRNKLHSHQREGFEFIWNNIAGGIYRDKSKNSSKGGGGCIISHAPGTGKTLLTIVFLQTYLKEYPSCRPVIIAPHSMLLTWEAEFRKWKVDITFHNLNSSDFSGKEKSIYEKFNVPPQDQVLARRLVKLLSWKSDGGILGISYKLFEQLAGKDNKEKQQCKPIDKQVSKILLELPGLFVLDEGHTPRNDGSLMWKALTRIKTERRIILSGTPFQNNFDELFNTLCLVRPKFAEEIQSRHQVVVKNRSHEGNEAKRKWASLTGSIGKDDIHEAEKLRELKDVMKSFVHVHKGKILQSTLPGLRHSVVVLNPTHLQNRIIECVKDTREPFLRDYYVSLFSTHPSLLCYLPDKKDLPEKVSSIVSMDELEKIRLKPGKGVKTEFLMELIKLSGALDEKVLVFSQYLYPLDLIVEQLKDFFKWKEMEEILHMHGKCEMKQRQRMISLFNDPRSKARVLLASTKACSEGINLVGGSRVVLLDVTWNPAVERQAISRAYRLGQKRFVYTYHLISSGTMEGLKRYRQAGKDRLSELLFSSSHKGHGDDEEGCNVPEDKILEGIIRQKKFASMFHKIIDQPKASDLIETYEGL